MKKKSGFSSSLGFVLSAAGSAVGVGNIWRFPYLAAKDGGGLFLAIYFVLVISVGFTLLTTDIAIGRRTKKNALNAFKSMDTGFSFLGILTFLVPILIMTYYSVVGAWVSKYMLAYLTLNTKPLLQEHYFTQFITSTTSPIVFTLIFLAITSYIVYMGVEKGIERFSKIIMPGLILMVIGIAFFSLTLQYTDMNGVTRTGLQGLKVYLMPDFSGVDFKRFLGILLDAMSQLFFSLSVSMGIMITYGSYVPDDTDLSKSITHIEIFDTVVALLAGMMIIPAVYVFFGMEGMSSGPGLMFISLPKVFDAMGSVGIVIGAVFFIMVVFAALTSCISIMETIVANFAEVCRADRKKVSLICAVVFAVASVMICLGYNILYFEFPLPNGQSGQLLDIMDYISNSFLMPLISLITCIFIGWIIKPQWIEEEMEKNGARFTRKYVYRMIIKYIAPIMMFILFLQSTGIL